jgi:REP element-mobilizing transposase RayT
MRHSKIELYVHLVWTTKGRESLLRDAIERAAHRSIEQQALAMGCRALAVGGMPDHVHLLLAIPSTKSVSQVVNRIKGVSSRLLNDQPGCSGAFRWQEGYGALSVSRSHVSRVISYIKGQREHHASGRLWPECEGTFVDGDGRGAASLPHPALKGRADGPAANRPRGRGL